MLRWVIEVVSVSSMSKMQSVSMKRKKAGQHHRELLETAMKSCQSISKTTAAILTRRERIQLWPMWMTILLRARFPKRCMSPKPQGQLILFIVARKYRLHLIITLMNLKINTMSCMLNSELSSCKLTHKCVPHIWMITRLTLNRTPTVSCKRYKSSMTRSP